MVGFDDLKNVGLQCYNAENRRILCELSKNGISIGNTVLSEASAEALIIAVAAMIERIIKRCSLRFRDSPCYIFYFVLNICLLQL